MNFVASFNAQMDLIETGFGIPYTASCPFQQPLTVATTNPINLNI